MGADKPLALLSFSSLSVASKVLRAGRTFILCCRGYVAKASLIFIYSSGRWGFVYVYRDPDRKWKGPIQLCIES